jgi:two-component system OmpR family response regulator
VHRIPVAADDPRTAETLKLYLEQDSFEARLASHCLAALNACRAALPAERTVGGHIANLRRKIESNPAQPALIATVFGAGYKWLGERHAD